MQPKNVPIQKEKENAAHEAATNTGLKLKSARAMERPSKTEPGTTVTETLATYELQDGTTITVNLDNPEYKNVIEKAKRNVQKQIEAGQRQAKSN